MYEVKRLQALRGKTTPTNNNRSLDNYAVCIMATINEAMHITLSRFTKDNSLTGLILFPSVFCYVKKT